MRRTILAGLILAAAAGASGCYAPTSPLELAGRYALTSVNGLPLPYVFPAGGATRVEALDDAYTLNPAGTFAEVGRKQFTTGSVVTISVPIDAGTFTRRGDVITMESVLFGVRSGTIRNGKLTLVQDGLVLVYAM